MGEVVTLVTGGSHPAIPVISDARRSGLKRNFRSSQRIFNLLRSTLDVGSSPRTTRKGDTSGSIGRGLIALAVNEPHAPFHSGLAKFADMWLSHSVLTYVLVEFPQATNEPRGGLLLLGALR